MNRNSRKLSDLIKELEDKGAISELPKSGKW